ncbi:unnamed protein product [Ostreobium quekettii]|uniref:GYF domain-containing protein n=1 Tax=Ostreobium quekettii TaxID=121088 RepID=A0A8S1IQW5_9CHLO|nr:unnamed protein product [Ostreobium quekettii]
MGRTVNINAGINGTDELWQYIDDKGNLQGPFSGESLLRWTHAYLKIDRMIRHAPTGIWAPLATVLSTMEEETSALVHGHPRANAMANVGSSHPAMTAFEDTGFEDVEMEDADVLAEWVAQARKGAGELAVAAETTAASGGVCFQLPGVRDVEMLDATTSQDQIFAVVDTNILMTDFSALADMKKLSCVEIEAGVGYSPQIVLVVPWVVMLELDCLKNSTKQHSTKGGKRVAVSRLARAAVDQLQRSISSGDNFFRGQTLMEFKDSKNMSMGTDVVSNDDRILQCCLQFGKHTLTTSAATHRRIVVVLFSNDKALCMRAGVNGIQALMSHDIPKKGCFDKISAVFTRSLGMLETLKTAVKQFQPLASGDHAQYPCDGWSGSTALGQLTNGHVHGHNHPTRASGGTQDQYEAMDYDDQCAGNSYPIATTYGSQSFTAGYGSQRSCAAARSTSYTESTPRRGAGGPSRSAARGAGVGTSSVSANIAAAEQLLACASQNPYELESATTEPAPWKDLTDRAADVFTKPLSEFLQYHFERECGGVWEFIVAEKPPWTLLTLLYLYSKHYQSVLVGHLPRQALTYAKEAERAFKQFQTAENVIAGVKALVQLLTLVKPPRPSGDSGIATPGGPGQPTKTCEGVGATVLEARVQANRLLADVVETAQAALWMAGGAQTGTQTGTQNGHSGYQNEHWSQTNGQGTGAGQWPDYGNSRRAGKGRGDSQRW